MTPVNRIARWDGRAWSSLASGFDGNAHVFALAEFDDGGGTRLYAGGSFAAAGGVPVSNIAAWDGAGWATVGGGVTGVVTAMQVFDDGSGPALFVGGTLTAVIDAGGKMSVSRIARWDGRAWSDVGGGVNAGMIADMQIWNDGGGDGLVVSGFFTAAGAGSKQVNVRAIARWRDGAWDALGPGALTLSTGYVRSLAVWPPDIGTLLIAGGYFKISPQSPIHDGLASWDGAQWHSIAPAGSDADDNRGGPYVLHAMRLNACDQLFMHSFYDYEDSDPDELVQIWNGTVWRPTNPGAGYPSGTFWGFGACCSQFDAYAAFAEFQGRLFVAGGYTPAAGAPTSNIAIWDVNAALSCLADADDSGVVNIDDLLAVISEWGPCSDCAGDHTPCGGDGVVNIDDLLAVISAWGPCP